MAKSKDIIQQLEDNEKPFGLMSEEMQKRMIEIGKENLDCFWSQNGGTWNAAYTTDRIYCGTDTYRLRSDYAKEPEIVECEIELFKGDLSYLSLSGVWTKMSHAPNKPDFAGTKFKPVFGEEIYTELWLNLDVEHNGNYKMTHSSHVLFRGPK